MSIKVTESAKEYIRTIREAEDNEKSFFHIGLKGGGCSGFKIDVSFKTEISEGDKLFKFDDIEITIEKKSYLYLLGTTIDYKKDLMGSSLDFDIPSADRKCGCGESISF